MGRSLRNTFNLSCLSAFLLLLLSCTADPVAGQLNELDRELESMEQGRVDFQKSLLKKYENLSKAWTDSTMWEAAYELFDAYCLVNTDSAKVYLQKMYDYGWNTDLVLRTKVCRAKYYALINHSRLEGFMPEVLVDNVSEAFFPRYCSLLIDIYYHRNDLSSYSSSYVDILEATIENGAYPEDVLLYYKGLRALAYNDTGEAVIFFNEAYRVSENHRILGACAEVLADIYHDMSNLALEKNWLITGAFHQLKCLHGELNSLYRLALILSDEGEYERSAEYIRTVIEQASTSGFPELVVGSASGSLAVNAALDRIEGMRQNVFSWSLIGAIVVLAVILLMLERDRRKNKLLLKTQNTLLMTNEKLSDTNKIKDSYLIRYMNLSISYLGMIEENRRLLRRMLKEEGVDALAAELRRTSTTLSEYKEFYRTFDNIFLGIYPDFVKKVNQYFSPEDRFKENGKLSTRLRLLALVRLGFTESGQIARFLNCSPETIYSHRSKLKSKALCSNFEEEIKSIV